MILFLIPGVVFSIHMTENFLLSEIFQASGYQIDSRLITPGDVFFAIRGEKNDGHDFLKEVQSKGARAAVVSKHYLGSDFGLRLFGVDDVGQTLRDLAKKSLENSTIQIVGVTGSVGKTTTKDFIATLLEGKFRVGKTQESQNSKLTFPLTVLNRPKDAEILVLEMGMSEMGDIARLVEIAPPDVAVLVKVGLAHAAYFPGGMEEIARGKTQIFAHPKTKFAIADRDYGLPNISIFKGEDWPVFQEAHLNHNLAAAVSVARYFGMTDREIFERIPHLKLPKMRFERSEKNGILLINDAYNANPESMKAALFGLQAYKRRKIAILGSMKELGTFSESAHVEIGNLALQTVDHLFVIGEEWKVGERFENHESLALRLKEIMREGDVVLIKGSRSLCMEKVICYCGF
ncbi:MAG TPA: Mur ligase family protein [Chlamydiales bacterium]|nr:Mur ligase family protein [Chlamydiales bacterium]